MSSENPKKITAEDIDCFIGCRHESGVKYSTIHKDLSNLRKFLRFFNNDAVDKFKDKYPDHVPKRYHKRGPSMEEDTIQKILRRASEINVYNWELMEAYGIVTLAICTGFRPKELRMLSFSNTNVSDDGIEIYAEHVKGERSYGQARWVTVHPDGVPIILKYLEARRIKLEAAKKNADAFFPPIKHNGDYISYSRVTVLKSMVEEELGIKFDLRKCRRTFGQRAINEGQAIHDVSLVMGHASIATTQREYADKEQHQASRDMKKFWDAH